MRLWYNHSNMHKLLKRRRKDADEKTIKTYFSVCYGVHFHSVYTGTRRRWRKVAH